MYPLKQSTAITVPIYAHDANGDPVLTLTSGSFTKRISKGSSAFVTMTVTITEKEKGFYDLVMTAAHVDTLGILSVTLTNPGCKQINLQFRVSAKLLDDLNDAVTAPTAVEIRQEMDAESTQLALIVAGVATAIAGIATVDGKVTALPSLSDIFTTAMTEAYAAKGVIPSLAELLFEGRSLLATMNRSGINVTIYKIDGTTTAATYVFDDAGNPSKLTRVT